MFNVVEESDYKSGVKHWWIIGGLGVCLVMILAVVAVFVCVRSSICYGDRRRTGLKDHEDGHKFHILRTSSFWCRSGRLCCNSYYWRSTNTIQESSDRHTNILKVIATDVFDVEKPVVFAYEEVLSCLLFDLSPFSELTCHNLTGSLLFIYEVAVKRMTTMKTKEFIAEMKVLCKVHHTNLVELIGYAVSDDELFLIYEYAHKGSLGSHIHDPQSKGHPTISWIMRVQIALDTARGLTFHRIFLEQILDFGLAKLVGVANDVEASATKVVGTFGYLALDQAVTGSKVSELLEPLHQPLLSSTKAREGSSGDENVQKNDTSLEELHNLAGGTDIKDIMSIGQCDALHVFCTLCKIGMKEDNDEITTKTRILSLELLQYATGNFAVLLLCFRENLKVEIGDHSIKNYQGTQNMDPKSVNATHIGSIKGSSLQCLVSVLKSLVDWEKLRRDSNQNKEQKSRKILQAMIGDYVGQHEEFPLAVHTYADSMNFAEMKFHTAIREISLRVLYTSQQNGIAERTQHEFFDVESKIFGRVQIMMSNRR
nr:LysM domain receptor-like kinase 3 [Tanacetum cinerariifolium]